MKGALESGILNNVVKQYPVTLIVSVVLVISFTVQRAIFLTTGDLPAESLGLSEFELSIAILTSMIAHASLEHLGSNLLMFLILGFFIERSVSTRTYLLVVLIGGLANITHVYFVDYVTVLGYSGATNALIGFGAVYYTLEQNRKNAILFTVFAVIGIISDIHGHLILGDVAHIAHISGLIYGAVTAVLLVNLRKVY